MPLKAWVKNALDHVIQECTERAGPRIRVGRRRRNRSARAGPDAADPGRSPASTHASVARADLRACAGGAAARRLPLQDRWSPSGSYARAIGQAQPAPRRARANSRQRTDAAGPVGSPARKPQPTRVQRASNDAMMSDAGRLDVAQIMEPEPPPPELPEAPRPAESAPGASTGTVAEAALRGGGLPGTPEPGTSARTMPASDNTELLRPRTTL